MTSFASLNGPSVTFGFPSENETRAPIEGGWRPSSASSTPAFCRDSLYFIIASTALASGMAPGAAFSYPFGIINIMNRIVISPWRLESSQRDDLSKPVLAEVDPEPDEDPERDLNVKRIAGAQVRADRAAHVSGQKNRAQDRRLRDQVDRDARQLENRERRDQRFGQSQMCHPLRHLGSALELHERAHQEHERRQNRDHPTHPHDFSARCHGSHRRASSWFRVRNRA